MYRTPTQIVRDGNFQIPDKAHNVLIDHLANGGVFAGVSSGASIAGSVKIAEEMDSGTIVTVLPDGGWKYLSSGAWTDELDVVEERATRINFW